jgi:DNA-binding XRE family transcriptional regulator
MNLGENIYRLRTAKNMSQGDLADALEVSRQSVSKWENNSAVPELDKLVKMAQLFGISLDELVTGEVPGETNAPQPESKVIYIEKPARHTVTPLQILGVLLLFCSALVISLSFLFEQLRDLEDCVPLCLLVALCGVFCLTAKKPTLWCSWIVTFGYWLYVFVLSARWESQPLLLVLGIILAIVSLAYTIILNKRGEISVQPWVWAVLTIVLSLLGLLLFINLFPLDLETVYPVAPTPIG